MTVNATQQGSGLAGEIASYNFAYLDEQTKRMIRRAILKGIAIPGYQVPFASRDMQVANDAAQIGLVCVVGSVEMVQLPF